MEWKKIPAGEAAKTCNHVSFPSDLTEGGITCTATAVWYRETACGCGAIHWEMLRCADHRIADLEDEVAKVKKTVEGIVRYARKLNPDIRTDEECVLFAAGYRQTPRDNGDEMWKALNAADVQERN